MTKRFLPVAVLLALAFIRPISAAKIPQGEWIIVVGGVSMHQWEKYKTQPHDHWWANFVHAARIRTQQLRTELGDNAMITWLVYKPGYIERGKQDGADLIANIDSVRDAYHLNLVYFYKNGQVIDYLNNGQPRTELKIAGFEYFGHSNKACFMFDYSNVVDSSSKAWMHEDELKQIDRRVFARGAFVKSWGCHTGEQMSKYWYDATGTRMWGAIGRTQFMDDELPILISEGGKWVN
ncbi:MAG TPA: hypothetical protein VJR93_08195 [Chthoniobacterales bacterium]|nr:hypothetical protein [Chthoniobacterales bacterium]